MKKQIISGFVMAILFSTAQAVNDEYEEAITQLKNQQYQQALPTLQSLAEQGDSRSIFNLAIMYHSGVEVAFDEQKAVELYKIAAQNNVIEAQQYLAAGYREGWWGLPMDYQKYRYWMDKAENPDN
ncbi:MAG: hypothetical protein L3J62_11420 [Gammaproteobacteria bacterium]|nr:hypothetical protein [Gammaproteobacteria bacterium]MCF6231370.1 hypothetical protein [Gammaproteobacteria bacterium]